jgi:transcription antitermination factor NusG
MNSEVENTFWTAFYTKPRNEKKVAERLAADGFQVYCPTRTVLKQWSDRKKKVKEVLFTSYLFAKVNEGQRQEILRDQGVVSSVFWLKEPVRIPAKEIAAIERFLREHPSAEATQSIEIGREVEVNHGPLKGEKGIVEFMKGSKVMISLDILGVTLQAEVPASQLI